MDPPTETRTTSNDSKLETPPTLDPLSSVSNATTMTTAATVHFQGNVTRHEHVEDLSQAENSLLQFIDGYSFGKTFSPTINNTHNNQQHHSINADTHNNQQHHSINAEESSHRGVVEHEIEAQQNSLGEELMHHQFLEEESPVLPSQQQHKATSNAALQSARLDWTRRMKEAVVEWMQQQKKTMEVERHNLVEQQQDFQRAIQNLQEQVKLSKQQAQEAHSHLERCEREYAETIQNYQKARKQLQEVVDFQQRRIQQLEAQLGLQPRPPSKKQALRQFVPQIEASQTDLSKTLWNEIQDETPRPQTISQLFSEPSRTAPAPAPTDAVRDNLENVPPTKIRRRRERLPNGTIITHYRNGTRKEVHVDGVTVIHFANGDLQVAGTGGKVAYWFASTGITRITEPDASIVLRFPNGQVERHVGDRIESFSDDLHAQSTTVRPTVDPPSRQYTQSVVSPPRTS